MKHLVSVPPSAGPHPLLCFLHGYDEAAPTPLEQALTRHGPLRPGVPSRVAREFLILAPQLPLGGDLWRRYAGEVRALVETQSARHAADAKRAYLTGFSFGGNGVFDLALEQPGFWAALWPVDPTRLPQKDPECPLWLSFGEVARHRKQAFIDSLALQNAASAPRGARLYLDEGEDHVGSARRAYGDERIYTWLLSQSWHEPRT